MERHSCLCFPLPCHPYLQFVASLDTAKPYEYIRIDMTPAWDRQVSCVITVPVDGSCRSFLCRQHSFTRLKRFRWRNSETIAPIRQGLMSTFDRLLSRQASYHIGNSSPTRSFHLPSIKSVIAISMPSSSKRTAASFDQSEATRRVKFRKGAVTDQRSQSHSNTESQRQSDNRDASDSEDDDEVERGLEKAVRARIWSAPSALLMRDTHPYPQILSFHSFQQRVGAAFYDSKTSTLSFLEDTADSSMFNTSVAREYCFIASLTSRLTPFLTSGSYGAVGTDIHHHWEFVKRETH